MAVRGVYSELEKKMLEDFEKEAVTREGWSKPMAMGTILSMGGSPHVTEQMIKDYGASTDPWNLFWSDEEWATVSRWGGLIAHPWFPERYKPQEKMITTPKGLFLTFYLMGHDLEMYQPIRPGDTIRAWAKRPTVEDATDLSGKGPRRFHYIDVWTDMYNQRDECIFSLKQYIDVTLHESAPKVDKWLDDYGYTKEELDYLAKIYEEEKPRGAQTLYWEDVNLGEMAQQVTTGPTPFTTLGSAPVKPGSRRVFERYVEPTGGPIMFGYIPDRTTGLLYPTQGGRHNNDRAAQFEGGPRAWLFNIVPRGIMTRCATNWMGDDAFMCKFGWRHIWRTPVGDTLIANGKVIKKYIENGEHLVDMILWCLNLRGTITDIATTTIKLVSREDKFPNYKKVIKR
jgi:acyl dehydratase